jgi:hypothetical protein
LDENFVNLANKINEILGLKIDEISITDNAGNWEIDVGSLGISAGNHISITATGQISHSAREASDIGWSTVDLSPSPRVFVDGLDFDDYGHVKGYKTSTLNFSGTGSVSVDQTTNNNQIVISSASYVSGDSPSFASITATGNIDIGGQYLQNGNPIGGGNVDGIVSTGDATNGYDVGIGTTIPQAKLDVQTDSFGSIAKLGTVDGTNNPRMFIGSSATGMYIKNTYSSGAGNLDFQNAVGASKMYLSDIGNLGIGTTSPYQSQWGADSNQLHVGGGGSAYGVLCLNGGGANSPDRFNMGVGGGSFYMAYDPGGTAINGTTHRITVSGSGYVGLNEVTPEAPLHVVSDVGSTAPYDYAGIILQGISDHTGININPPADKQAHLRFMEGGVKKWQLRTPSLESGILGDSLTAYFWDPDSNYSGAGDKFKISPDGDVDITGQFKINGVPISSLSSPGMYFVNGRVGINKTSPGYTLHIERNSSESQHFTSLKVGTSVTGNHNYAWLGLETDGGQTQIFTGASSYTSYGGPGATNIYNGDASIYVHPEGNSNVYKLEPDNFELNLNGAGPGIKINAKTGNPYLGFLSAGAQKSYLQHLPGDALYVGSSDDIKIKSAGTTDTAQFTSAGLYLPAPGATSSSTSTSPLSIANAKNTVSMFLGMNQSTSDWGTNDYSGSIRWNGSGQAWGDLTYYPRLTSGGDTGAGQFRFSTAGSVASSTPNAKVGVGSLYSADSIVTGATNPAGFGLRVCNKNAQIYNTVPILELKNNASAHTETSYTGYILFRDSANTQAGFMGFGSNTNNELGIWNQSTATSAHTRIKSTTGAVIADGSNGLLVQDQTLSNANAASIGGKGQGRFSGWWGNNYHTGPACEIGLSSGNGWILAYDRTNNAYLPSLNLACGSSRVQLYNSGHTVKLRGTTVGVRSISDTDPHVVGAPADRIVLTPTATTGGMNQITTGVAGQHLQIATTRGDGVLTEGIKIQTTGEVRSPMNPHVSGRRMGVSFTTTAYLNGWDLGANTGNHYDNSTGSFTAPLYGKYLVTITGLLSSPSISNQSNLWLQKNSVSTYFMGCYGQMTGSYLSFGGSHTVLLSYNDTIRFVYNHSGGGGLHNSYLNFSIVYLG